MKQIYKDHIKWIKSKRKEGKRADLRLSNLKGLKLKKAVLAYADLQQSNLFRVNLSGYLNKNKYEKILSMSS